MTGCANIVVTTNECSRVTELLHVIYTTCLYDTLYIRSSGMSLRLNSWSRNNFIMHVRFPRAGSDTVGYDSILSGLF